jgi:hypothetical protein
LSICHRWEGVYFTSGRYIYLLLVVQFLGQIDTNQVCAVGDPTSGLNSIFDDAARR